MRIQVEANGAARLPSGPSETGSSAGRMAMRVGDGLAILVALGLAGAILANILMFQNGKRVTATEGGQMLQLKDMLKPAPSSTPAPASARPGTATIFAPPMSEVAPAVPGQAGRPVASAAAPASPAVAAKAPVQVVADVQRELAKRGFYDGPADGAMGARTDAAIRAFEQSAGLKVTGEPSEALLAQIRRAPSIATLTGGDTVTPVRPPAELPTAGRILAVQKALARLGYGPLKPDGKPGMETRLAIQRFERDRNLPVTGEMSDRVVKELAAVTGAPVE